MWHLRNTTPFAGETAWLRDERGAEFWLVSVRASFDIDSDGRQSPAAEQTEVQRAPVFTGDPMTTGLLTDTDFALHKDGTDVLVAGHAYAPERRPVTRCSVRLKVETIDKQVEVYGERLLTEGVNGVSIGPPEPFVKIPLSWERTYGGWDEKGPEKAWEPTNPVGRGFGTDPLHLEGTMAPNLEYPDSPYRGPKSGRPAGFGPVAHHWEPRVRFGGTYDKQWQETRDPLLPEDFDRRYFRCAPVDQQTEKPLRGNEEVVLDGFTADGHLRFTLPRIDFEFTTSFRRYGDIRQKPSIHTLWLIPDQRRFEIVYSTALEVPPGREEKLIGTTVRIKRRLGKPSTVGRSGVWSNS